MYEQLLNQYNKVFASNGSIKACGREECMKLIELCERHSNCTDKFGNIETGFMDVNAITTYINTIHR